MQAFFNLVSPYLYEGNFKSKIIMFCLLSLSILGLGQLVYTMGGTYMPYVHMMYVPLIIAGFWLGISAGLFLSISAGFILGPYMPMDVAQNIAQTSEAWLIRLFFFSLVTLLTGMGGQVTRAYLADLKRRYLIDFDVKCRNYKGLEARYNDSEFAGQLRGVIVLKLRQATDVEKTLGVDILNAVMGETKSRLKDMVGDGVIIGRVSSDTFALCIEDDRSIRAFTNQLVLHLDKTFHFHNIPFLIEMYIGYVVNTLPSIKRADLPFKDMLKSALIAADAGLEARVDVTEYDESTHKVSDRNIYILHELKQALIEDKLTLNYQPIISLKTGEVLGMEALARWSHPTLGMVSPLEFTGVAEQTQLINPYTKWLLQKSMGHQSQWRKSGSDVNLSLNFSMKNFEDPSVVQEIFDFLDTFHIPPESLQVEVTETAISKNIKKAADILYSIRERGVKIAIDDFGTGQSSLRYLFELPVDVIKIDQSFTRCMLENSAADAIIRAAITMGHEMNLKVIAEGIEAKEQLEHLQKIGCDFGQGYYISRPMPVELASSWLEAHKANALAKDQGESSNKEVPVEADTSAAEDLTAKESQPAKGNVVQLSADKKVD